MIIFGNKKKLPKKIIYYEDELGDEFSSAVIKPRRIDESYKYDRDTPIGKLLRFFFYRIVAIPLALCYLKLKFGHKIVGGEAIKREKRGIFVYGNHTQATADALIPTFITHPSGAYVIVHPNNVSMPLLGRITPYIGAIPLPDSLGALRAFRALLDKRFSEGRPIYIYPEAHIWPYFTGIRPFSEQSFCYPVKYDAPVYCFTNVYKKRKFRETPRIVTYVDGPFRADDGLTQAEKKKRLRELVYGAMCERSRLSDIDYYEYRPMAEKEKRGGKSE